VDRLGGELGVCRVGRTARVSSHGPHFGEERPLVGMFGSGTIFMSGCNLHCLFCQNYTISQLDEGREVSADELAGMMLELQARGCHNINFVTPTHQAPHILEALVVAAGRGLTVPLVYNTGGYDEVHTLKLLDGVFDIYMPDIKYADPAPAAMLSGAEDYPEKAFAAAREMHAQVGELMLDARGTAYRGLLVRHLVLPGGLAGTEKVVRFIAEELSRDTYVNIMEQYYPCFKAYQHPPMDRRITLDEYDEAIRLAREAGLRRIDGVTV
jgi:putative pyruvate formate lyase activating enzyme